MSGKFPGFTHVRRNFVFNVFDGVFFFSGIIFISPESVLPVLITALGGTPLHISLIPVLRNAGFFLPSLFVVSYIRTLSRKKPLLIKLAFAQRVPYLVLAFVTLAFGANRPMLTMVVLLVVVFVTACGGGLVIPPYFYLTAKTIPIGLRGRLFAVRNLSSYFVGIAAGGIITAVLSKVAFPANFSVLMFIGFGLLVMCIPAVALIKEPDAKKVLPPVPFGELLGIIGRMLRANVSLRWYIVGRMLYAFAFASYSYFAVYLIGKFDLEPSEAGIFTIIIAVTFIVVNPVLGMLADRKGHLANHVIGMVCIAVANVIAIFSSWYPMAIFALVFGAITHTVIMVSGFALPMEFGEDYEIPIYISTVGIFVGVVSIGILFLGIAAERWGYPVVFWICAVSGLAAAAVFAFKVTEPRKHVPPPVQDVR